ncbi:MAG: Universal stress protein UspA [Labilithrix sp.]|nr:Universal stress protein UspA [Labilithrix sp.]
MTGGMKSLLVAVDDSPGAVRVLRAGIDMARQTGAQVRLLRVVGVPADLAASEWAASPTQVVDGFLVTARRDLEEMSALVPDDILGGMTVQVGTAWNAICSHAVVHDCDMIVIGAPRNGFLERLVGTTAAKVVNHADRAVFVVPREPAGKHAAH